MQLKLPALKRFHNYNMFDVNLLLTHTKKKKKYNNKNEKEERIKAHQYKAPSNHREKLQEQREIRELQNRRQPNGNG